MAIKTIYTCDRCGHEQTTINDLWTIRLVVTHGNTHPSISMADRNQALWCRKCCNEHQMINEPKPTPTTPNPVILTLEQRIVALMEEVKEDVTESVLTALRS